MKDNPKGGIAWSKPAQWLSIPAILVTVLNLALLASSLFIWYHSSYQQELAKVQFFQSTMPTSVQAVEQIQSVHEQTVDSIEFEQICNDTQWCSIPMPSVSYFHFDPPKDARRWRKAQLQAMRGEQVLLREAIKAFPTYLDFLDGDISFRKMHLAMDFFVDERRDLNPLASKRMKIETDDHAAPPNPRNHRSKATPPSKGRKLAATSSETHYPMITAPKPRNGKLMYPWEMEGRRAVPEAYDFRRAERAPVVSIGYTAFTRDSQTYFSGNRMGGAFIDRGVFFRHWRKVMHRIDTPFVAVCTLNENWGFLSTRFPNRTAGWGRCCDTARDKIVYDFLNHPKTLLLVTNQHVNVSHPKLMIWPRGIPITWGHTRMMIWDTMHKLARHNALDPSLYAKRALLFAASSSWGPRPQILRCVSDKFSTTDFDGHIDQPAAPRLDRIAYYEKMSLSMFGVGLPGLGYDCFRNWELMTMGTIVILEKGVGFDRTMYRLPALLVEDFYDVTPDLLRTAYLEALYRAEEFEFKRLTMSYWFSVLANVSNSMSTQPFLDAFPVHAEDTGFMRPREPFACALTNSCGEGTKRVPKKSC